MNKVNQQLSVVNAIAGFTGAAPLCIACMKHLWYISLLIMHGPALIDL